MGTSRWREKRDVPGSAVLRERRTPQLRAAPSYEWGRQRTGRGSAVHPRRVHPLRGCFLTRLFVFPKRPGPIAPPLGTRVSSSAPSTLEDSMDAAFEPLAHHPADGLRAVPSVQTLAATAIYHLSETGRKASLL